MQLLAERKLAKLRHLGEDNLTSAATDARKTYQNIPQRIISDTALARQGYFIFSLDNMSFCLYFSEIPPHVHFIINSIFNISLFCGTRAFNPIKI